MRRIAGAMTAVLTVGVLAGAACGGDDGDEGTAADKGAPDQAGKKTPSPTDGAVDEARVTIDESVWFGGFAFDLGEAVLTPSTTAVDLEGNPDPSVGQVTIDAVIENLGDDDAAPDQSQMYLEQEGQPLDLDPISFAELPTVPAGETSNAEIIFDGLTSDFELEEAELVFGDGNVNQARVPLDGEGDATTLQPVEITPTSPGQAGEVTVTVTGGRLIHDDPVFHNSLPAGDALLIVEFSLTTGAGLDRSGGTFFGGEHIRLALPDGTSVAPGTFSDINEVLEASATYDEFLARFDVSADLRGPVELALRGPFAATSSGSSDDVEGRATFELEE